MPPPSLSFKKHLHSQLDQIESAGLFKKEAIITSPQNAHIQVNDQHDVLNLCSNNYLGFADDPGVIMEAKNALDARGFGMASVRFICGTQDLHKHLELKISQFLGTEDTILYPSCFDANGGLFEPLLTHEDAIISDSLNHASIIDGIRLCKATRYRYNNNDMADLETKLQEAENARFKIIATDGVFSMDGIIANLKGICDLADKYSALVMVDDCHATGFFGKTGRGTPEYCGVQGRIDIITGTLGKALGGAGGGYTTGHKEVIEMLRQRSRPYLFSNAIPPHTVAVGINVIDRISHSTELRDKLMANTKFYREGLKKLGLTIKGDMHPIVPIMIRDAALSQQVAAWLLKKGIYAVGFFYPVVPKEEARIRTQVSSAHSNEDLQFALDTFAEVKKEFNL